ncbi:MAG: type II toxin-antitoxin system VapC family toxin [bacterium]
MDEFIIIDTDILIDAGRKIRQAVDRLDQEEQVSTLAISVVVQMELLVGCRNKQEQSKLNRFLKRFQIVGLSEAIGNMSIELLNRYHFSHGLLIPDSLIAAVALTMDAPLLSKNQKDYRFIDGLRLLPYP